MIEESSIANIKYKLATAITAKRQELGVDQTRFAADCGVAQSVISRIETGKLDNITIDFLVRLNCRAKTELKLFDALK